MGFISGALDKSVFSKKSYAAAIGSKDNSGNFQNGYAVVRIKPSKARLASNEIEAEIIGVMDYDQGGLSFSIPSNWRDLGGMGNSLLPQGIKEIQGPYEIVNNLAQIGGGAAAGAAFASKLIYQQSGYLEINIPMMVVDWQGTGQPLMTAILLANYCLPKYVGSLKEILEKANDWFNQQLKIMQNSENAGTAITGNLIGAGKHMGEGVINFAEDKLQEGMDYIEKKNTTNIFKPLRANIEETMKDSEDLVTLRSSPVPVRVEIGQFFKRDDMVIKNLSYEFSKEMTKSGPLYVKFKLELSSRKIMVSAEDTGLFLTDYSRRYLEANFTGI